MNEQLQAVHRWPPVAGGDDWQETDGTEDTLRLDDVRDSGDERHSAGPDDILPRALQRLGDAVVLLHELRRRRSTPRPGDGIERPSTVRLQHRIVRLHTPSGRGRGAGNARQRARSNPAQLAAFDLHNHVVNN